MKKYVIAIDGPAGSGKSTISFNLAKKISFVLVKTGDMFRAIAYKVKKENIDIDDEQNITELLKDINITFEYYNSYQSTFLDNENITEKLLDNEIGNLASKMAKIRDVRNKVLEYERNLSIDNNIVMEGRDIGTVVFPIADVKIFLTASVKIRAQRRYEQNLRKGINNISLEQIEEDIILRDENDTTRKEGPLKKAYDAIEVNTDSKSIEEVEKEILKIIYNKIGDINDNN